jgi:hypothetical protein
MRREMLPFNLSLAGVLIFLAHFWLQFPANIALWAISAVLGISSIHHGMRIRAQQAADDSTRWMPESAVKIGWLILLGVTLSAIFLLVPQVT